MKRPSIFCNLCQMQIDQDGIAPAIGLAVVPGTKHALQRVSVQNAEIHICVDCSISLKLILRYFDTV